MGYLHQLLSYIKQLKQRAHYAVSPFRGEIHGSKGKCGGAYQGVQRKLAARLSASRFASMSFMQHSFNIKHRGGEQ